MADYLRFHSIHFNTSFFFQVANYESFYYAVGAYNLKLITLSDINNKDKRNSNVDKWKTA